MTWEIVVSDVVKWAAEYDGPLFHALLCDPPYHLTSIVKRFGSPDAAPAQLGSDGRFSRLSRGFMGQTWDGGDVAFRPETWEALARVCTPGAYLLAFGGTRTFHRLACAIEDAGWEIRDTLMWVYGSGFPKSHDVSKGIDRAAGAKREVVGRSPYSSRRPKPIRGNGEIIGVEGGDRHPGGAVSVTAPATAPAKQWDGWGTALKPAWEPIIVARKPLEGTVAANVQKWGAGALNIDGCRVGTEAHTYRARGTKNLVDQHASSDRPYIAGLPNRDEPEVSVSGRWPANLIHDGSEEVVERFPQTTTGSGHVRHAGHVSNGGSGYKSKAGTDAYWQGDSGSAARFFYEAKASADEREQNLLGSIPCVHCGGLDTVTHKDDEGRNVPCRRNVHPTVKPIALAQYLARLILPAPVAAPRRILVPFSGSGSEMLGALYAGWEMVLGIEISPEYADIARARLARDIQAPLL